MKAIILLGKNKNKVVEISQWCNDWFMINTTNPKLNGKPFVPSSLAFTNAGMLEIKENKNNGYLFKWFEEFLLAKPRRTTLGNVYMWSFRKRKK